MAEERKHLVSERDRLLQEVRTQYGFDNIIGRSAAMRRVFEQIRAVAKWTTTVLIRGESGTGKELVANSIHYNSLRADKPFIRLNCAATSDQLLESELFGHEKGAFTGAADHRLGRFEQADGGTLFLDEIGEISSSFQAKLLRVLQEGEFERVGSSQSRNVDVRIIAATNRNLEEDVQAGKFREDLYYRLNVMPIYMPPLRSRIEDLPDLARSLAGRIGGRQGRQLVVTDCALRLMIQYDWPGNIRELENVLERAAVMAGDGMINQRRARSYRTRRTHPLPRRQSCRASVEFQRPGTRRARADCRRPGIGGVGPGQGRPVARHDSPPDRLQDPAVQHHDEKNLIGRVRPAHRQPRRRSSSTLTGVLRSVHNRAGSVRCKVAGAGQFAGRGRGRVRTSGRSIQGSARSKTSP